MIRRCEAVSANKISMPINQLSIREQLAAATNTSSKYWEDLDGPDSGVGVDYWFRDRRTGAEAYVNVDQNHLTICVEGEIVFVGSRNGQGDHAG